jgi:hypothetical protein
MQPRNPIAGLGGAWRGKGLVRASLLLVAAAAIAAAASAFGIARDYGYLHASILTASPGGQYHTLATRLADRAKREHLNRERQPLGQRSGRLRREVRPRPRRHACARWCAARTAWSVT